MIPSQVTRLQLQWTYVRFVISFKKLLFFDAYVEVSGLSSNHGFLDPEFTARTTFSSVYPVLQGSRS